MLLSLILLFCKSELELTEETFYQYIGGDKPVVLKYYSPRCPHCREMAPEYHLASQMFEEKDIIFAQFDCLNRKPLCDENSISGWPTVRYYAPGDKTGIEYDGDRSADSFIDFTEEQSGIKSSRPPRVLKELTPISFEKIIQEKCSFITFYSPTCQHSKRFLPNVRTAANAFKFDSSIKIAALNCAKYDAACSENNVTGFPTARIYKNGEWIKMTGPKTTEAIFEFLSEECNNIRGPDGLLDDFQGTIDGAYEIAQEYIKPNSNKQELKNKMKELKGTEMYLKVMEKIDNFGVEIISKTIKSMRKYLNSTFSSQKSLDEMKKRFNVFTEFEILPSEEEIKKMEDGPEKIRLTAKFEALNPKEEDELEFDDEEEDHNNIPVFSPLPIPKKDL